MTLNSAGISPIRGELCNLRTGEAIEFLLNPTNFSEQVRVNYNRLQIPGLSHQVLQFVSTGNATLPIEFYLDKFFAGSVGAEDADILNFKRFLQALTVPSAGAEDVVGGGPPRALFIWPGLVSLTCVLTSLEFKYEQFDVFGDIVIYRARTTFEEIRDVRITSEEIRDIGSERGGV